MPCRPPFRVAVAAAAIGWSAVAMPAPALAEGRAQADCPGPVRDTLALSAAIGDEGRDAPAAQACRIWPHDPAITLAAIAYPLAGGMAAGERSLRLVVAMLDTKDGHLLGAHHVQVEEDAGFELGPDGLRLDTARYDLAPGLRAFGLVVRSAAPGPSCPDGRANDELTLYIHDGDALRPVFSTALETWLRVEGEPCAWSSDARVVTEQAASVVAVEPTSSNGHADLRVIANVERHVSAAGDDSDAFSRRRASRVVRFDGHRYDTGDLQNGFFWGEGPVE